MNLYKFCEDTDECQCRDWTYDHSKFILWGIVELGNGQKTLGHHPGCPYWIPPPHPSLSGLTVIDFEKLPEALAELTKAYSKLYWSVNPPKDPDSSDS